MFLGGQEEVFIAKDWGHQRNYSESLAAKVDAEVRNILETQYERARAIIERQLSLKQHGHQALSGGKAGGVHKPGKGGWSPAPIRPGGRGRRG